MNTKVCSMCKHKKPTTDFYKDCTRLDGFSTNCKFCKKEYQKIYYKNYNKKNRQKRNDYFNQKYKNDTNFRLIHNLRSRLRQALKSQKASKNTKTVKLLGCSIEEFKQYLKSKFKPGMTFKNYGKWHIDHIKPLSKFDLNKDVKLVCHYTNLQPLWAKDNLSKNNKM